jgi:hypothetical protein
MTNWGFGGFKRAMEEDGILVSFYECRVRGDQGTSQRIFEFGGWHFIFGDYSTHLLYLACIQTLYIFN